MTSGNVRSFTKANFTSDVLNSPLPVMLHFYATWVEPCKQLTPIINSLADKYADQIVFVLGSGAYYGDIIGEINEQRRQRNEMLSL